MRRAENVVISLSTWALKTRAIGNSASAICLYVGPSCRRRRASRRSAPPVPACPAGSTAAPGREHETERHQRRFAGQLHDARICAVAAQSQAAEACASVFISLPPGRRGQRDDRARLLRQILAPRPSAHLPASSAAYWSYSLLSVSGVPPQRDVLARMPAIASLLSSCRARAGSAGACARRRARRVDRLLLERRDCRENALAHVLESSAFFTRAVDLNSGIDRARRVGAESKSTFCSSMTSFW